MKKRQAENYIILPACLLLLNALNQIVEHLIDGLLEPWIGTLVVMLFVLLGSSITAFLIVPWLAGSLRLAFRQSTQTAGELGQFGCAIAYFGLCYWLYFILNTRGPGALLP